MRFYSITEAGYNVSGRTNNPNTPAYAILAKLRLLRSATIEKLMEVTGFDLGVTQLGLSQLMSTRPPLVMAG